LRAALDFDASAQLVLCAGAPDTPEIGEEVVAGVEKLREWREGVFWIDQKLPKRDVIRLLSRATVFACPSIYEPLGTVNLEAMACEAAVVASATGGIVGVVVDGVTAVLVPLEQAPGSIEPAGPAALAAAFAARVNTIVAEPDLASRTGAAERRRAVESFAWSTIAEQTACLYERLRVLAP
jgi:starch synthase